MKSLKRFGRAWIVVVASGALVASADGRAMAAEKPGTSHAPGVVSKARGRKKTHKTNKSGAHVRYTAHAPGGRRRAGGRRRGAPSTPEIRPVALLAPSPGPQSTPEAARAMDQVRRNQIERAESAARRPELTSRWRTVEFLLNGVDEEHYPEAGFWRALSAYRRGDIEGGDRARARAPLAARDVTTLDGERTIARMVDERGTGSTDPAPLPAPGAAALQTAAFVPPSSGASPGADRIRNNAPYVGPGPAAPSGLATN
jgi:hypothetical protein